MQRALILCLTLAVCLPLPARAWTFAPLPICTLTADQPGVTVTVTFDPVAEIYAIHIDRRAPWPAFPVFSLRFDGPSGMTISTDRHVVEGTRITVTDRGFGNVLDGLALNETATAILGDTTLTFDLNGAAAPVDAFRACPSDGFV